MVMAAATTALSALGGMFANQGHSMAAPPSTKLESSTTAIALAKDRRAAKAAERNAQAERAYAFLTDPQVLGLLTVVGGVLLTSRLTFHPNKTVNGQLRGMAAGSCMLMGLGRAGVGDMTSLSMAAMTAATLTLAGLGEDIEDGNTQGHSGWGWDPKFQDVMMGLINPIAGIVGALSPG